MTGALAGAEARTTARRLVDALVDERGSLLDLDGIDLAPAVEQVLFASLRSSAPVRARGRLGSLMRRVRAAAAALAPAARLPRADVLVVLLSPAHRQLFAAVEEELAEIAPETRVARVAAGRAAARGGTGGELSIAGVPRWRDVPRLLRPRLRWAAIRRAIARWPADELPTGVDLRRVGLDAVERLAGAAIQLDAAVGAARPALVVAYDEIDAWGRLLTAIAPRHGAMTLDLPHAEAVDVEAIRGCAYDAMAVYGPRAAAVLSAAGVPPERVEIVGPARFDSLARSSQAPPVTPPRVVLAAQYRAARMTESVRRGILAAAVAAAEALDGELVLKPHPGERPVDWEAALAEIRAWAPVPVRLEATLELHALLPGAALLVTGWSNSVYEAVLAGVPAVTVHLLDGDPPMSFAAEGIADEARHPSEAAALARRLVDPGTRSGRIAQARRALEDHLGPLDGRAARRTAELVARLAATGAGSPRP